MISGIPVTSVEMQGVPRAMDFQQYGGKAVGVAVGADHARGGERRCRGHASMTCGLREGADEADDALQSGADDLLREFRFEFARADDVAGEGVFRASSAAGVDEHIEALLFDEATDGDDVRRAFGGVAEAEAFEIDAVVDAADVGGVGTELIAQVADIEVADGDRAAAWRSLRRRSAGETDSWKMSLAWAVKV
jgi:hypothetical protein